MGNVGTGELGKTFIGKGIGSSPSFVSIGTSSGLTAHGVVLAQGNNAFVATAPGVANQSYVSNGAAADPSWQLVPLATGTTGTLAVANGGTSAVSMTDHGVLIGHGNSAITATAAGTAGQVLTSNGAGSDPTYQAAVYVSPTPIVLAALSVGLSNATGDGTGLTPLIFDNALVNVGSAYNATTGIFTAPTTGNYMVACNIMYNNLNAAHSWGEIVFNKPIGGDYTKAVINPGLVATTIAGYTSVASIVLSGIVTLLAAQQFRINTVVYSGTKTVGIQPITFGMETALSIYKI